MEHLKAKGEETGKSLITLESTYWGNQAFGIWDDMFFADVEHITHDDDGNEKGMLLANVETTDGKPLGKDWIPASKCVDRRDFEGKENMVAFNAEGAKEPCTRNDYEARIEGTTSVFTKYRTYQKLQVDLPYMDPTPPKQMTETVFDGDNDLMWETYHFSAKYENDEFQCWTADMDDVRAFAADLAQAIDQPVAVTEEFL